MLYVGRDITKCQSNTYLRREDDILVIPNNIVCKESIRMIDSCMNSNVEVNFYSQPIELSSFTGMIDQLLENFDAYHVYYIQPTSSGDIPYNNGKKAMYSFFVKEKFTNLELFLKFLQEKYMSHYAVYGVLTLMRSYSTEDTYTKPIEILKKLGLQAYLPDVLKLVRDYGDLKVKSLIENAFDILSTNGILKYSNKHDENLNQTVLTLISLKRYKELRRYLVEFMVAHDTHDTRNWMSIFVANNEDLLYAHPEATAIFAEYIDVNIGRYVLTVYIGTNSDYQRYFKSVKDAINYVISDDMVDAYDLIGVSSIDELNEVLKDDFSIKIYDKKENKCVTSLK